jgi:DNA-binding XRE family transcriptional regulator
MLKSKPKRIYKIRTSPGTEARIAAGYSIEAAAKRLGIKPRTYRNYELHGKAPDKICDRAARLFNCSSDVFFFSPEYIRKRETLKRSR